jgi:membrane associated rhomboid family serine protease
MVPPASPETIVEMGGAGGRFARGFRHLRDAKATWQILRILILIQAVPVIWDFVFPPGYSAPDKLTQAQILLGLAKPNFLSGNFWQPLSYALIHADWPHLLLNGAAILLLGSKVEHIAGKRTIRLVAITAALAGGLFFLLLSPSLGSGSQRLVGSSAVCFAFLALLTTLSPESRFLPFFVSGRSLGMGVILLLIILVAAFNIVSTLTMVVRDKTREIATICGSAEADCLHALIARTSVRCSARCSTAAGRSW